MGIISITEKSFHQQKHDRSKVMRALPSDGSFSDYELNDVLFKLNDARLQLTAEDLEDLKRIAGKYR
jgi:hypothetical protein